MSTLNELFVWIENPIWASTHKKRYDPVSGEFYFYDEGLL
jgi:hypothetical protein